MIVPGSANSLLLAGGGYTISRSLRFRSSATAYLNRTQSAGSQTTWTWSGWVKRGKLTSLQYVIQAGGSSGSGVAMSVISDDIQIEVGNTTTQYYARTTAQYRDPSAWYHIVAVCNTTSATSTLTGTTSDRLQIWINGVQVSSFSASSIPTQNFAGTMNQNTVAANIGRWNGATPNYYFDGFLTEVNFIDGQALTASSFGQTNPITGVWQPIKYAGTYGTNGFYLNFSDNSAATAAAIGKDYSGNGNNWTPNNISVTAGTTYDSMLDVPTLWADGGNGRGNYCVFNPLAVTSVAATFAEANLKVTTGLAGGNGYGTFAIPSSGKWYWEITAGSANSPMIGICDYLSTQTYAWSNGNSVFYYSNGQKYVDGTGTSYGATYTTNDVIGVAVDADSGTITFYKNNASQGSITHAVANLYPCLTDGASGTTDTFYANFGQRPFSYTPPSGFKALNTLNLPTPTISNGAKYMAATLYTGNGSTQSVANTVNGVSFKPDLVWLKARSNIANHALFDSTRGTGKVLQSSTTAAEATDNATLTSFDASGFSLGAASGSYVTNTSTYTFVGWQWQAGAGTTSSNTSGTITSTVCVGATQGFSVVTWTGTGANATIGHGLGVAPSMIICKHRNATDNWIVYHTSLGGSPNYLWLNLTSAAGVSSTVWNTFPTSSVFGVGTDNLTNLNGGTYVGYCFAAVKGYSAFGSYTGNGSADGPFVYCGFRPRWVMIKSSSLGPTSWIIYDSSRDTYNIESNYLLAESSNAEASLGLLDFTSNGFKIRSSNTTVNNSTSTFIYAAFAESPFNISLAR